jgi:glutamate dehydrogenase
MDRTSDTSVLLQQLAKETGVPLGQIEGVYRHLEQDGSYRPQTLLTEIGWFYRELGLDHYYFRITSPELIAEHIQSLFAARVLARNRRKEVALLMESVSANRVMLACRDEHYTAVRVERQIEVRYPEHRIQSYRSRGPMSPDSAAKMRLFFLTPANYVSDEPVDPATSDIRRIGDKVFLELSSAPTKERYQAVLKEAANRFGTTVRVFDRPDRQTKQLIVCYRRGSTHSYFSAVSDVINSHGLVSLRKYVEHFANGLTLFSIHFDENVDRETMNQVVEDVSLVYVLPRTSLTPLFRQGKLSAQEVVYAYAAWKFAHQFLTRYSEEYATLAGAFADDPVRLGLLTQLKQRLSKDTFTEDRIYEVILQYPALVKECYRDFAAYHFREPGRTNPRFDPKHNEELKVRIETSASSLIDQQVLKAFLQFNRSILKTNFYRDSKVALGFRLDPAFLPDVDYPEAPYGVFYVVGSEFRGYHVRFRDVARGGVRIVRSGSAQMWVNNSDFLFDENYQLALTQQRKNKDIPEGGSKGTLLLSLEHQDKSEVAFKKYVDGLLDLMLPNEEIADHLDQEENLYLGPDEGTAEMMDWAAQRARERGYPFWKAFTTGKSVENGGIPHDLYGMTTRSIRAYVSGILEKLGLAEEGLTKTQTGGPDGDLGSNEIKLTSDRTLTIIDGSGVLHDPGGIDRSELIRLAHARQPVRQFNRDLLGAKGFLVTVDDRDAILPDGTRVASGYNFRNAFHLDPRAAADLFVPCGGRPDSVHINNVHQLFDGKGRPRFKYVVEGANLFFTAEARLALEKAGVILFKDASANKGGVTSSSLEVLAALSLSDDEFHHDFCIRRGNVPEFYKTYVEQVQERIVNNARAEFECIWRENDRSATPRSLISDQLSEKINRLNDRVAQSSLWQHEILRQKILQETIPRVLLERVGLEAIISRVPAAYLRAIFGAQLASTYIYQHGLVASEVDFVEYVQAHLR